MPRFPPMIVFPVSFLLPSIILILVLSLPHFGSARNSSYIPSHLFALSVPRTYPILELRGRYLRIGPAHRQLGMVEAPIHRIGFSDNPAWKPVWAEWDIRDVAEAPLMPFVSIWVDDSVLFLDDTFSDTLPEYVIRAGIAREYRSYPDASKWANVNGYLGYRVDFLRHKSTFTPCLLNITDAGASPEYEETWELFLGEPKHRTSLCAPSTKLEINYSEWVVNEDGKHQKINRRDFITSHHDDLVGYTAKAGGLTDLSTEISHIKRSVGRMMDPAKEDVAADHSFSKCQRECIIGFEE